MSLRSCALPHFLQLRRGSLEISSQSLHLGHKIQLTAHNNTKATQHKTSESCIIQWVQSGAHIRSMKPPLSPMHPEVNICIRRSTAKASAPPPAFHLKWQCPWKTQQLSKQFQMFQFRPTNQTKSLFQRAAKEASCFALLESLALASTTPWNDWNPTKCSAVVACCKNLRKDLAYCQTIGPSMKHNLNMIWIYIYMNDMTWYDHYMYWMDMSIPLSFQHRKPSAAKVVSQGSVVPPCSRPLLLLHGRVQLPGVLHPWLGVTMSIMSDPY